MEWNKRGEGMMITCNSCQRERSKAEGKGVSLVEEGKGENEKDSFGFP